MKILFSGYHNPHFLTITEYIEAAIEQLDHQLISFDDRQFVFPGRLRQVMPIFEKYDLKRMNQKLLQLAQSHQPDICLVTGGHRIFPETIQKLNSLKIKTVLWTIDVPLNFEPIVQAAPYYKMIFCGGSEAIEILNQRGIENASWLPFACDPKYHYPATVRAKENEVDLAFIGSFYPNRADLLNAIASSCKLGIWGPGWTDKKLGCLPDLLKGEHAKPEEWVNIYAASKIALVIHYQDGKTLSYQASPKVYEALACRKFLLVDQQKDVLRLFEDGKDAVFYNSADDLKAKIKYYLERPQERQEIAENGYRKVLAGHTYKHRLDELFKKAIAHG